MGFRDFFVFSSGFALAFFLFAPARYILGFALAFVMLAITLRTLGVIQ